MPNFGAGPAGRALAALAAVALVGGCTPRAGATAGPGALDERPVLMTTFTVLADIASVVAGDEVRVESLTGPGTEVHGYEPSPDDLRRADGADVLVANGLGLEAWLQDLVAPLGLPTVVLSDVVEPLPIHADDPDGPVNPHAWMSPRVGARYAERIAEVLADLAPEHADGFEERAARYGEQLEQVARRLADELARIPAHRRVLVSCEGAFAYLARDAGLDEAFLWPVNAERQGTPRQVARVVLTVQERDVPAVFCESTVSPTAQRQVARETGARFGGILYVDSLSEPDGPVPTYLALLRHDVDLLVDGLAG